jgi:PadR family transcriptional regulator, regulatory protein PadR
VPNCKSSRSFGKTFLSRAREQAVTETEHTRVRCIIRALCLANGVSALAKLNSAQTALDLLVLTVLERRGPLHGYGIATDIEELSQEALRVEEGSLYPALHRMEELGWITAEWKVSETKRRARFYRVTSAGRKQLIAESERWLSFSAGVARVLKHA